MKTNHNIPYSDSTKCGRKGFEWGSEAKFPALFSLSLGFITREGGPGNSCIQVVFPAECRSASVSEGGPEGRVWRSPGSNSAALLSPLYTLAIKEASFDPEAQTALISSSLKMALIPTIAQMTVNPTEAPAVKTQGTGGEGCTQPRNRIRSEQGCVEASDMQLSALLTANCTAGRGSLDGGAQNAKRVFFEGANSPPKVRH